MKVIETHEYYNDDYGGVSGISVEIHTEWADVSVSISEGEPDDMSIERNLSDALYISELVKLAYEAGKRGEEWEYEFTEER